MKTQARPNDYEFLLASTFHAVPRVSKRAVSSKGSQQIVLKNAICDFLVFNFSSSGKGMAPEYKFSDPSFKPLAEPIRFILSYGKANTEDIRTVETSGWPSMPVGKCPILEIDDKVVQQSGSTCRYFAKQYNLCGKSDLDALQIDILVDTISDFRKLLANYSHDENQETRAPKLAPIQKETVPFYLSRFDKLVEENGGYFVNGQLTWVDLYFIAISDYLQEMAELDFFKDYPNLRQLKEKVLSIPQIKDLKSKRAPGADS